MRITGLFTAALLNFGLLAVPGAAEAQSSRLYFAGYMGLNTNSPGTFKESTTPRSGEFKFDNATSYAGALGLRLDKKWRIEGEVSYRNTDFDNMNFDNVGTFKMNGDLGTWLFMLNGYYDFDFKWKQVQPYVSGGVGIVHHSADIDDTSGLARDASDTSLGLAWQLGGGLKYRMSDDLAFTGGYRYLGTTDAEIGSYDFEYGSHEWRVGLEYDLPVDMFK